MTTTAGLDHYKRSMISKQDDKICQFCGAKCVKGRDYAGLSDAGWQAICVNCAESVAKQVSAVVISIEKLAEGLSEEALAGITFDEDKITAACQGTLNPQATLIALAEAMAVAIASAGDVDIVVANRTWDTAKALAGRFEGRAVRLSDLPSELAPWLDQFAAGRHDAESFGDFVHRMDLAGAAPTAGSDG